MKRDEDICKSCGTNWSLVEACGCNTHMTHPRSECGCKVKQLTYMEFIHEMTAHDIEYCPLHSKAFEMREVLEEVIKFDKNQDQTAWTTVIDMAEELLRQVKGETL